ncbi:MAG: hypothetical protein COT18_09310 [Elusimicrobia bacterium CG08_land_8_20_14_0_20_59_10]|nr:MAG: hypothetical protein COT18_09310 [Elusimicrobia bacterium CG08_land_8_20_14_0_20_59_10]
MSRRTGLLLLPALLALTAWAPGAGASVGVGRKAAAPEATGKNKAAAANTQPAPEAKTQQDLRGLAKTYEFKNETVVFPAYWNASEKTKNLIRSEFYYQWDKPGRTCATDSFPWAYVVISNDSSLCWSPDRNYFTKVRSLEIAGSTGTLYKHNKVLSAADSDAESCPGQSYMALVLRKYGNCYSMKFITREKYVRQFFPDFKFIMDNFRVFKPQKAKARQKGPALRQDGILP